MSKYRTIYVEREEAPTYLLLSLVSFGATVIGVRLFLQLTGYPQLGGGTLHIAHLLWGGLALFAAVLLVLIWDNPGAMSSAAVLSGIGIGLFIDEVGKFITSSNDYFYPPAAPIIYGLFLLTVLIYLYVRQPDADHPKRAILQALEDLQDAFYGVFKDEDVVRLQVKLDLAMQSERSAISNLAEMLNEYIRQGNIPIVEDNPGYLRQLVRKVSSWSHRLTRHWHRRLILAGLFIIAASAWLTFTALVWVKVFPETMSGTMLANLAAEAVKTDVRSLFGQYLRVILEVVIGGISISGIYFILRGNEHRGLAFGLLAVILSLTAVQLITFYLDQFTAILPALFQLGLLLLIMAYRRWYLADPVV